eukprot:14904334-Ditylum_brightwellii.AAC.1
MESKYTVLSTACSELLSLKNLLEEVMVSLGITKAQESTHTTIWEDNEPVLKVANMELPYPTLRSKHFALCYH